MGVWGELKKEMAEPATHIYVAVLFFILTVLIGVLALLVYHELGKLNASQDLLHSIKSDVDRILIFLGLPHK